MQKNQKIKASSASLLAPCTPLFASQTRALRSNSDAPGRSVPVVRLTLTSRGRSPSPSPSALGSFSSPEDSSPVLRGAGSRSETEGLRYLPRHNISCVHWRRKILRLYNHLAQEGDFSTSPLQNQFSIFNFQLLIFNLNRPNGRDVKQILSRASRNPGCLSAKREFPRFQRSEANLQPLECSLDFASRQKYEVPFGSSQKQQALNED